MTSNATPQESPGAHAVPSDAEEIYFEGSPPARAFFGKFFLAGLISIGLLVLAGFLIHWHVHPWWIMLIIIAIALLLPLIPKIQSKAIRYRISNYRIDFERGLLSKNIDTIELWHVEDLHFHQSLLERLLNLGNITIIAHDDSLPRLELFGLPNPRPIYEMLKQRVIAVKRSRGVIKMDAG
jgi:uncharacterized membrane protein YdbT with pleckstrin-like domain